MRSIYRKTHCRLATTLAVLTFSYPCFSELVLIGDTRYISQSISLEGEGLALAVGDFNKDGSADLAVTSKSDRSLVIFTGDKDGKFTQLKRYDAGHEPSEVVTADLNDDGHLDLVIANHETSHLTLYVGAGGGRFTEDKSSPLSIAVSPHPHIVQVEDIDGDHNLDLIVDHRDERGLLLVKGVGDGRFESRGTAIFTGGDPYLGFALGDINKDGVLDVVTPNSDHIGIVLGSVDREQAYTMPERIEANSPFAVELVDLNADGYLDTVYASLDGSVTVCFGDGSAKFDANKRIEIEFGSGAKRIATGDINGDGIGDVLVSNWASDVMLIMGSDATPNLHRFKPDGIENPWMSKIADLNNDKKGDLIVSDGDGNKVAIYLSATN